MQWNNSQTKAEIKEGEKSYVPVGVVSLETRVLEKDCDYQRIANNDEDNEEDNGREVNQSHLLDRTLNQYGFVKVSFASENDAGLDFVHESTFKESPFHA